MPDPLDRFTPRARRVLELAADEATRLRHSEIGTEHLLLGLSREGRGVAAMVLRDLGADPDEVRRRLGSRMPPGELAADSTIGLSPGVKHAIEKAAAEAKRLRHNYLGTEHLLLGLLSTGEGLAFVTLDALGVSLDGARRQVVKLINESPPDPERVTRPGVIGMLRGIGGGRARPSGRAGTAPSQPRRIGWGDEEACRRCGNARRPDWRFCAFCGEPWPRCDRCDAPIPRLEGVRFCPQCGGVVERDEPE